MHGRTIDLHSCSCGYMYMYTDGVHACVGRTTHDSVLVLEMKHREMNNGLAAVKIGLESLDGVIRRALSGTDGKNLVELETSLMSLRDDITGSISTLGKDVIGARKAIAEDADRVQSLAAQLADSFTANAAVRRRVNRQQQQIDSVLGLLASMRNDIAGRGDISRGQDAYQQKQQGQSGQTAGSRGRLGASQDSDPSSDNSNRDESASNAQGVRQGGISRRSAVGERSDQSHLQDSQGNSQGGIQGDTPSDRSHPAGLNTQLSQKVGEMAGDSSSSGSSSHNGQRIASVDASGSLGSQSDKQRRGQPPASKGATRSSSSGERISTSQALESQQHLQDFAAGSLSDPPPDLTLGSKGGSAAYIGAAVHNSLSNTGQVGRDVKQ